MIHVIDKPIVSVPVMFQVEQITMELIDEMWPLWKDHYQELAIYKDIPLNPMMDVYLKIRDQGNLRIFTARHKERLVGYMVFIVSNHPHYATMRVANQDILFIDKAFRKGFLGYRFIKWADQQLKSEGVNVVFQHVKVSNDLSPLLFRLGYVHQDTIYSRRLS